jgi:hypothetical protein
MFKSLDRRSAELTQIPSLSSLCLFATLSPAERALSECLGPGAEAGKSAARWPPTYGFYNDAQGGVMVEVSTMDCRIFLTTFQSEAREDLHSSRRPVSTRISLGGRNLFAALSETDDSTGAV